MSCNKRPCEYHIRQPADGNNGAGDDGGTAIGNRAKVQQPRAYSLRMSSTKAVSRSSPISLYFSFSMTSSSARTMLEETGTTFSVLEWGENGSDNTILYDAGASASGAGSAGGASGAGAASAGGASPSAGAAGAASAGGASAAGGAAASAAPSAGASVAGAASGAGAAASTGATSFAGDVFGVVPVDERTYGTSAASGGKCLRSSNGLGVRALVGAAGAPSPPAAAASPSPPAAAASSFGAGGGGGGVGSFGGGGGVFGFGRRSVHIGSMPGIRSTKAKSRSSPISA
uniref:Uncharacterized protein n=1 Tax=Anopheles culicifacies TaxID=139723 RepID=A0A182LXH3_9DIPT